MHAISQRQTSARGHSIRPPRAPLQRLHGRSMSATSALLAACESLYASPDASGEPLRRVLEADAALQTSVAAMLRERDDRAQSAALMDGAAHAQKSLLRRATRMQSAQLELSTSISRARSALTAADEAQASGRHVPAATLLEYAERVSYSNAAQCGSVAFQGAERNGFYQGWGTPTPQQHMVAASRFANPADLDAEDAAASAGAAPDEAMAPTFTAVSQPQAAADTEPVSLSFGDDSEDEDSDF